MPDGDGRVDREAPTRYRRVGRGRRRHRAGAPRRRRPLDRRVPTPTAKRSTSSTTCSAAGCRAACSTRSASAAGSPTPCSPRRPPTPTAACGRCTPARCPSTPPRCTGWSPPSSSGWSPAASRADELDIAQGYLTGSYEMGLEDSGARMSRLGGQLTVLGRLRSIEEQIERWQAVTLDDTRRVIERVYADASRSPSRSGRVAAAAARRVYVPPHERRAAATDPRRCQRGRWPDGHRRLRSRRRSTRPRAWWPPWAAVVAGATAVRHRGQRRAAGVRRCGVATSSSTSRSPTAAARTLPWLAMHGIHAVVGTTGSTTPTSACCARRSATGPAHCVMAPNFAISAVLDDALRRNGRPVLRHRRDGRVPPRPQGRRTVGHGRHDGADRMAAARGDVPWAPDPTQHESCCPGPRGEPASDGVRVHSVRMRGMVAHQEVIFGPRASRSRSVRTATTATASCPACCSPASGSPNTPASTVGLDSLPRHLIAVSSRGRRLLCASAARLSVSSV